MTVPKKRLGSVIVLGLLLYWAGASWAEDKKPDAPAPSAPSAAAAPAETPPDVPDY